MFSSTSLLCELGKLLTTLCSVICIMGPTIQGNGIGQKLGQELQDGELKAHPGGMQCGGEQAQPSWAVAESAGSRGKKGKKLGVGSKSGLWRLPQPPSPHPRQGFTSTCDSPSNNACPLYGYTPIFR